MRRKWCLGLVLGAVLYVACAHNSDRESETHPIEDHPVSLAGESLEDAEREMAKLIALSRSELPRIRKRFVAGLAQDEMLFLTIRLYKPDRSFEQAFAEVKEWREGGIAASLASDLVAFTEPRRGDSLEFQEDVVVDWTILAPGGVEEGNRLGHFLDRRRLQR